MASQGLHHLPPPDLQAQFWGPARPPGPSPRPSWQRRPRGSSPGSHGQPGWAWTLLCSPPCIASWNSVPLRGALPALPDWGRRGHKAGKLQLSVGFVCLGRRTLQLPPWHKGHKRLEPLHGVPFRELLWWHPCSKQEANPVHKYKLEVVRVKLLWRTETLETQFLVQSL